PTRFFQYATKGAASKAPELVSIATMATIAAAERGNCTSGDDSSTTPNNDSSDIVHSALTPVEVRSAKGMATRSGVQNIIAAKRRSSSDGNSVSRSACRVGLTNIANSTSGTAT